MTGTLTTGPGLARALAAVRGAEIGLLRAVALDVVAVGAGDALDTLGADAIELIRGATGATTIELQAHATPDGGATTFLGRAGHGVAVSAHLSVLAGEEQAPLHATARFVGTHGSVLVDLLRPLLDVRTVGGRAEVPFGAAGDDGPSRDASDALSSIAESARSGQTVTITW